jgi:hypothetical protein
VCARACLDASRQKDSLMGRDSGTDSLIRSASRTAAAKSVVYVRRAKVSSTCFGVAPRCAMKCSAYSRCNALPFCKPAGMASYTITCLP